MWSFGITVWEVFTRGSAKPYAGIDNFALAGFLEQNKRLDPPKNSPKEIHDIVSSCWRKHPETRPTFTQLVIQLRRAMTAVCGMQAGSNVDRVDTAPTFSGAGTEGNYGYDDPQQTDPQEVNVGKEALYALTVPDYAETCPE
eukprot:Opistho-2@69473